MPLCITLPAYVVIPFFFFNDTATTEIYTLSLHDALPILASPQSTGRPIRTAVAPRAIALSTSVPRRMPPSASKGRSEEHTSELQSHLNLVCRLLLEKKNKNTIRASHTCLHIDQHKATQHT